MVRSLLPIVILSALTHLAPALSESTTAAKKELEAAITAEDEAKAQAGSPRSGRSGQSYLRMLNLALETEDRQQAASLLDQIGGTYISPAVAQASSKLQESLNTDIRKQEDDFLAAVAAVTKEVGETIPKATKIADLDPLLDKQEALISSRSIRQRSQQISSAIDSLQKLKNFTSSWQDYLQAVESGQRAKANQLLRNLSSEGSSLPVPRSLVISLIRETSPDGAKLTDQEFPTATELDQIAPVIKQLQAISASARRSSDVYPENLEQTIQSLAALEKAYQDFKAGLPTNLEAIMRQDEYSRFSRQGDATSMAALRVKLLLLVLPAYLGLPEDAAKPGEDVVRYLERVEKDAAAKGDATTCTRIMETRLLFEPAGAGANAARTALVSFRAGQAQEVAGQPFQAAVSYQTALTAGPGVTLATLIGKRLEEIKRTHPEEYKKASSTPPSPRKAGKGDSE